MAVRRTVPSIQLQVVTNQVAGLVTDLSQITKDLVNVPERIAREDIERADRALAELRKLGTSLWIKTGIPPEVFRK